MNKYWLIYTILILFYSSCKDNAKSHKNQLKGNNYIYSHSFYKYFYYQFIGNILLKNKHKYLKNYVENYKLDSCALLPRTVAQLNDEFKGISNLGDIDEDNFPDSVFVLNTFTMCALGDIYCFTSLQLPPLITDSECCHPNSLFICPDIDEDGIHEIGIFYSSCVSRFKSIRIFKLKNNSWKEIGQSDFDTFTQEPDKIILRHLIRKISKNKFSLCNFLEGETYWNMHYIK